MSLLGKNKDKYFVGKIKDFAKHKGWFFGQFMDNPLLRSDLVEVAYKNISNKKSHSNDRHYHKGSVEISVVLKGKLTLTIDDKKFSASAGEFFVIYPYIVVDRVETDSNTELIIVRAPSIAGDKFLS